MRSDVAQEELKVTELFDRDALTVFENYERLKYGVTPSQNAKLKRDRHDQFNLTFTSVREANHAIASRSNANCQRFIRVYNDVGSQQSYYFGRLLDQKHPPDELSRRQIESRLQILHFFSRALFGFLILKAEAGQSTLDSDLHYVCSPTDRPVWTNLLMRAQTDLEGLTESVIGLPSALGDLGTQEPAPDEIEERLERDRMYKHLIWIVAEIAVSIYIWEKFITPSMGVGFFSLATLTPMGRITFFAVTSIYVTGWVAFDRFWRQRLSFLQPPPDVVSRTSISNWENLMKAAEDFLNSGQDATHIYTAYENLLRPLRREAALEFLEINEPLLSRAEDEFGSVEKATSKLKEALRHENSKNGNDDGSFGSDGAPALRAAK